NVHVDAADFAPRHTEILEVRNFGFGDFLQQPCGGRALEGKRRDLVGDVFDGDIEPQGVLMEPAEAGVGGGPTVGVLVEAGDGAIVNHFALLVAPAAIDYLAGGDFVDVAGDDAVHEPGGVTASDQVFEQGRDVNEGGGVANGVVLVLVVGFVDADGIIAGPFAVVKALAETQGSIVN